MLNPMKRAVRLKYLQLLRLNDNPHSISLGFAIGIASGALPVMGVQTIVALPFVLFLRCNVLAMAIGVWWTNPVTFIPIYYSEYLLGTLLGSYPRISFETFSNQLSVIKDFEGLQSLGASILIPMVLGALVYSVVLGPLSYIGMKRVLEARRSKIRAKRAKRKSLEVVDS